MKTSLFFPLLSLALAAFFATLAVSGCKKNSTYTEDATLPQYERELIDTVYVASFGYGDVSLEFKRDTFGLLALLEREADGMQVTFDVRSEFFPFETSLPSYLVLLPRDRWTFEPYTIPTPTSYASLLMEVSSYTNEGTVWPPLGMDNFSQANPIQVFLFNRIM